MAATILEALQNAKYNLFDNFPNTIALHIGREQLKNAVTLLELGYNLSDEVETLIEEYGSIDNVPEKELAKSKL